MNGLDYHFVKKNEKRWSIANLLQSSKQYVSFFQLLALVSVWNDYLATLNKNNLEVDNRFLQFFNHSTESLLTFNLFIPVGLIVIMLGFTLYLWKHRIK